ncbi:hypothetical protein LN042_10755 [Kitasatospora sp. RB6PN24]|uniref:hypothetical protein n=1 Tax=Kitasatospora humi TaxID=2893891 RepID=UPI001E523046|nr:hypothetical protein [Kitasatospora humi]MCC9307575.1 hypothetical protein [Kitasatospora humi]
MPTILADDDAGALLKKCHDSPAAPAYVLPLAWAGLALGIVAVCWGGWQLAAAFRKKSRRFSAGHALLCAVLPLAAIAVLFQVAVVRIAVQDSRPQPSPCFGGARVVTELR